MSSPSNPQHEPTMEEILASIRKIISEDQSEPAKPQAAERVSSPPPAPRPEPEPEILDLTDEIREEPAAPEPVHDDSDLISSSTRGAFDRLSAVEFEEEKSEPEPPPVRPVGGDVEAVFARAVQDAFQPTLRNWVDSHGDEIVNRLKPLIREWMDQNLPELIESAVQQELSRIRRKKR